jgi:hypothetical protein
VHDAKTNLLNPKSRFQRISSSRLCHSVILLQSLFTDYPKSPLVDVHSFITTSNCPSIWCAISTAAWQLFTVVTNGAQRFNLPFLSPLSHRNSTLALQPPRHRTASCDRCVHQFEGILAPLLHLLAWLSSAAAATDTWRSCYCYWTCHFFPATWQPSVFAAAGILCGNTPLVRLLVHVGPTVKAASCGIATFRCHNHNTQQSAIDVSTSSCRSYRRCRLLWNSCPPVSLSLAHSGPFTAADSSVAPKPSINVLLLPVIPRSSDLSSSWTLWRSTATQILSCQLARINPTTAVAG